MLRISTGRTIECEFESHRSTKKRCDSVNDNNFIIYYCLRIGGLRPSFYSDDANMWYEHHSYKVEIVGSTPTVTTTLWSVLCTKYCFWVGFYLLFCWVRLKVGPKIFSLVIAVRFRYPVLKHCNHSSLSYGSGFYSLDMYLFPITVFIF